MFKPITVLALLTVTAGAGCAGSDDASTSSAPSSAPADVVAFCDEFNSLQSEQPESYVGSEEHLADIEGLLAVSPESVAGGLVVFRDYVASGVIDADADPDSTFTDNWPDEVQSAINDLVGYAQSNC